MQVSRQSFPMQAAGAARCIMTICAVLAFSASLMAQVPQASYPLLTNLTDLTGTYGPVLLTGTPPPAAPANGVCHNGIYAGGGGQDIRTPNISTLDPTDFQIDVDFNLAVAPAGNAPVIMMGDLYRWIGLYVQPSGIIGLKYNNSNFTWSTTTVVAGIWYSASIRFETGIVQLYLNGAMIHQATLGALNDAGDRDVTTNDWSTGAAYNGCIRNLVLSNDASLVGGDFQVNTPAVTLVTVGGSSGSSFAPITATAPVGTNLFVDLTSTNIGLPWDLGYTLSPAVPGTAGGLATPGGQFLNLDLTDPTFNAAFSLTFTTSWIDQIGVPVSFPAPVIFTGQIVVINPGSVDGYALSHANQLEYITCSNTENFDTAQVGPPNVFPGCWTDGGGTRIWSVGTGGTSSGATGPSGDNTSGAGNYMYCETSAPAVIGDTYILNAPPARITGGGVQFAYHMYGATMGTLELQELVSGTWTTLWTMSGDQGNAWISTPLILTLTNPTTLRFVYTRGASFTGDAAIDDFMIL